MRKIVASVGHPQRRSVPKPETRVPKEVSAEKYIAEIAVKMY